MAAINVVKPAEPERQLSKKELKKKELEDMDAVLAELGILVGDTPVDAPADEQGKRIAKAKAKPKSSGAATALAEAEAKARAKAKGKTLDKKTFNEASRR